MADELNTASVAVQEPPAIAAPSPSVPVAKLSEDEIFASLSHSAEEPVAPATTPSDAVTEQPIVEEPEADETEIDLASPPEGYDDFSKFKDKFKGEGGAELRQIVGRQAAITERQPDFQQVVSILERIPNVDELEQITSDAGEWQRVSQQLSTNPADFVSEFAEKDPQRFAQLARAVPDLLRQTDQREWLNQRSEIFQEILDNAARIASSNNDSEVFNSLQVVAREMGLRLGASQQTPRTDPRDTELAKLRKEREDRISNEQRDKYQNFQSSVESEYISSSLAEIETDIKAALTKANYTPESVDPAKFQATLKRMVKETYEGVDKKMREQPDTQKRISDAFAAAQRDKRMGDSDRRSILDYALKRNRATRPAIMREVVNEWTKSIIGAQQKKIEAKQTVAAQTKDAVGSGAPPAKPTNPSPTAPGRKRSLSEEEIFASIGR